MRMIPEREAEDALNRAQLDPDGWALARLLQIVAFTDKSVQGSEVLQRIQADPDGFRPAPLYVSQALTLRQNPTFAARMRSLLGGN